MSDEGQVAVLVDEKKEAETKGKPNWKRFLHPRGGDSSHELAQTLLRSDKDNEVKTRIPHVFAMTVMDLIGPWSSGAFDDLDDLLDLQYNGKGFGGRFRINAIASGGLAREEYKFVAAALALGDIMQTMESSPLARLEEGNKKR